MAGKGEASGSKATIVEAEKEFAWSRGLGIELSPVKTQSARKKASVEKSQDPVSLTSTEGGALRALKALARSK
jgi:hypothetical protein